MVNINKIAELSNLELSSGETARFSSDLEQILKMVQQLPDLGEPGVLMESGHPMSLRKDTIEESYPRDALLQNAPEVRDGCFAVPKTVV